MTTTQHIIIKCIHFAKCYCSLSKSSLYFQRIWSGIFLIIENSRYFAVSFAYCLKNHWFGHQLFHLQSGKKIHFLCLLYKSPTSDHSIVQTSLFILWWSPNTGCLFSFTLTLSQQSFMRETKHIFLSKKILITTSFLIHNIPIFHRKSIIALTIQSNIIIQ